MTKPDLESLYKWMADIYRQAADHEAEGRFTMADACRKSAQGYARFWLCVLSNPHTLAYNLQLWLRMGEDERRKVAALMTVAGFKLPYGVHPPANGWWRWA